MNFSHNFIFFLIKLDNVFPALVLLSFFKLNKKLYSEPQCSIQMHSGGRFRVPIPKLFLYCVLSLLYKKLSQNSYIKCKAAASTFISP